MKILHTSDWHLGRNLYGRRRYKEFESFLDWLLETINAEQVDLLLVAGDIFDTNTPSNHAQQLYYRFLSGVARSCCTNVVVIGGNHDSPSFLEAPKQLLKALNVHVVGRVPDDIRDEVLLLTGTQSGDEQLIVCAVPYLRDRDVRQASGAESAEEKLKNLVQGIEKHYREVLDYAETLRQKALEKNSSRYIPIVGMGHLFTSGGVTVDGDGVRELYVGSLAHVSSSAFLQGVDYLALGHLHVPQKIGGDNCRRYSGSPIPMGFGEAGQKKQVLLVHFSPETGKAENPMVEVVPVPSFQALERVCGSLDAILNRIEELKRVESTAWLEVDYNDESVVSDLRERLEAAVAGTALELLRIRDRSVVTRVLNRSCEGETLDDLDERDVFERCLDSHGKEGAEREELVAAYNEILQSLQEADPEADEGCEK